MSKKKTKLTVVFLPYAPIENNIKISNVTFWPFYKEKEQRITDPKIVKHLERLFDSYINRTGNKTKNITVASIDKPLFDTSESLDIDQLENARYVLFFACVERNEEYFWCTSDNFEMIYQNFVPGELHVAVCAGGLHEIVSTWKIEDVKFTTPDYVNQLFKVRYEARLMDALNACLQNMHKDIICRRIIKSLRPFYQSYKNTHDVDHQSRILLMTEAFVILLDLRSRKDFRQKIDKLCGGRNESRKKYPIIDTRTNIKITDEILTEKQIWAEEFYKLRDRIIHGDEITLSDLSYKGTGHIYLAELFFKKCIKEILSSLSLGFISYDEIILDNSGNFVYKSGKLKEAIIRALRKPIQ